MPQIVLDISAEHLAMLQSAAAAEVRTPEAQAVWYLTNALDAGKYWATRRAARAADVDAYRRRCFAPVLAELQALHRKTGWSGREISARSGLGGYRQVSHTTVNTILSGRQVPFNWRIVESIVHALGGDEEHFTELWKQHMIVGLAVGSSDAAPGS